LKLRATSTTIRVALFVASSEVGLEAAKPFPSLENITGLGGKVTLKLWSRKRDLLFTLVRPMTYRYQ
jgi:hypothetical protein